MFLITKIILTGRRAGQTIKEPTQATFYNVGHTYTTCNEKYTILSCEQGLKNLTPNTLRIHRSDGILEIPSSGVAHVALSSSSGKINGIDIHSEEYGKVTGLPPIEVGVWLIASREVAMASPERFDVLIPGESCQDANGKIGYKGLVRIKRPEAEECLNRWFRKFGWPRYEHLGCVERI
jgi:hypothetical protein